MLGNKRKILVAAEPELKASAHKVLAPPSQVVLLVASTLRQSPRIMSPLMGRGHGPMGPTKPQVCGQGGFKMDLGPNLKSRVPNLNPILNLLKSATDLV